MKLTDKQRILNLERLVSKLLKMECDEKCDTQYGERCSSLKPKPCWIRKARENLKRKSTKKYFKCFVKCQVCKHKRTLKIINKSPIIIKRKCLKCDKITEHTIIKYFYFKGK